MPSKPQDSTRAWNQLGQDLLKGNCSFKRSMAPQHETSQSGHGFRLQEQVHLTELGQQMVALSTYASNTYRGPYDG